MRSIWKNVLGVTVIVGVTTAITTRVVSQDYGEETGEMAHQEMMQEWMKLAQPGPEHAELAKAAGTWDQEITMWMYPDAEPQTSAGVATIKTILVGRFLIEKVRGEMDMDGEKMLFEGLGIFGYDNFKKKYVYTWVDNMGTMIMLAEGTSDATGKVITYVGEIPDPTTGNMITVKTISRKESDDREVVEMHNKLPDGAWFKSMEIVMTRSY